MKRGRGFHLVLILFCALVTTSNAQITGVVKYNNAPVERAVISSVEKGLITVTNEFGQFKIEDITGIQTLVVEHLSFQKKKIASPFEDEVEIELIPRVHELTAIDITPRKKLMLQKGIMTTRDYIVEDDLVLTLSNLRARQGWVLRLTNLEGDLIREQQLGNVRGRSLFTDCKGRHYLVSYVAAYRVHLNKEKLFDIEDLIGTHWLYGALEPCLAEDERRKLYFEHHYHSQSIAFFEKNKIDSTINRLFHVADVRNIEYLLTDIGAESETHGIYSEDLPELWQDLKKLKYPSRIPEWNIFFRPINAQLIPVPNGYVLFNHLNDTISHLNAQFGVMNETKIDYHHIRKWDELVYYDHKANRFYTSYKNKTRKIIYEIDLATGRLKNPLPIEDRFVSGIKFYDNELFYLTNDFYEGSRSRRLMRMAIENNAN